MKKIRVAINGFGRIGRITFRALQTKEDVEVVAINDLTGATALAHLLKYDSIHGRFSGTVSTQEGNLVVNGHEIRITAIKNPAELPWKEMNIDVVLECTGLFLDSESASKHIQAGAKKVLLSAPAKSSDIKMVVLGANEGSLTASDTIISNASCTTNCVSPLVKIVDDVCGIENGFMNTIHAYTADQRLQDAPHSDLRRARAAALSLVPTSTGAARAIGKIFPHLSGKLDGTSVRVPTPTGSLTDMSLIVRNPVDAATLNAAFKKAAENELKGILEYTEDPIVSADIVGNPHSCIFDAELTFVKDNLVKVFGWYDNEAGYSNRLADLCVLVGKMS
ncbi:MAG: type I glyceraldehyde-3-phosphate dehydrogenase [Bacteroidetes bacterium]|jgi:glyceraldehyde 3-phosphate dehydrogenase|nr:type I glyceraldehyde-3-phosphate dehydrogenase [Bacteroidota bacterium]